MFAERTVNRMVCFPARAYAGSKKSCHQLSCHHRSVPARYRMGADDRPALNDSQSCGSHAGSSQVQPDGRPAPSPGRAANTVVARCRSCCSISGATRRWWLTACPPDVTVTVTRPSQSGRRTSVPSTPSSTPRRSSSADNDDAGSHVSPRRTNTRAHPETVTCPGPSARALSRARSFSSARPLTTSSAAS
jgi:hypothetical protein